MDFEQTPIEADPAALPTTLFGMIEEPHTPIEIAPMQLALATAVHEVERYQSRRGWDAPLSVFALVPTAVLMEEAPDLPAETRAEFEELLSKQPGHLTPIEQVEIPDIEDVENLLAHLAWPDSIVGAVLSAERLVVPSSVEETAPADPEAQIEYYRNHPDRDEVRIVVGVIRNGISWCALRARSADEDNMVHGSTNAVPNLVTALLTTFDPEQQEKVVSEIISHDLQDTDED